MDDLQFWLYIIVVVIYFIARGRKKLKQANTNAPRQAPGQRPAPQTTSTTREERPPTFEELLKEITESRKPQPKTEYVDYDEELEERPAPLEQTDFDYRKQDKAAYTLYEEGKREAFQRPSLEEKMERKEEPTILGRFKSFDLSPENQIFSDYIKELRDPEGFKKALILSELINRKHF